MKPYFFSLFFTILLFSLSPLLGDTDLLKPSLSEILNRYTEAMGGTAKLSLLRSARITGTILQESDPENPIELIVIKKYPYYTLTHIEVKDAEILQGYDGKTAWKSIEYPNGSKQFHEITGDDKIQAIRDAPLTSALLTTKLNNSKLERIEDGKIGNSIYYRIKITFQNAASAIYWIDQKDYLERRIEFFDQNGELIQQLIPSDFETFGGVMFAMKTIVRGPNQLESRLIIDNIETNIGVFSLFFSPPSELKIKK